MCISTDLIRDRRSPTCTQLLISHPVGRMKDTIGIIRFSTRLAQVVLSLIIFACSAYLLSKGNWVWIQQAFGFALFTGLTGMMLSSLMLVGPRFNAVLAERLPGFLDIILSGIWTLFFLSAGGNVAAGGSCSYWYSWAYDYDSRFYFDADGDRRARASGSNNYCGVWNAVTAFCFLNFALYAVSTVFAGLDLRAGKGLVKPRRSGVQGPATDIEVHGKPVAEPPYPPQSPPQA